MASARTTVTFADLTHGLQTLGLRPGMLVEVHSSLSQFGWVEGGAATVVQALMDCITPAGTIVMSAYPVSPALPLTAIDRANQLTWKVRKLPLDSAERTGMGLIADTFRQHPDAQCGHSFFRTCAWGHDAAWHTEGYHGLLACDGCCLLLGVGIDRCSSMHAGDSIPIPAAIQHTSRIPDHIRAQYPADQWSIGYGESAGDNAWQKVWEVADRQGLIRHAQIGAASCQLFKARAVVGLYKDWRQRDPYGLYGIAENER